MTVDMKILDGLQSPGLLMVLADACLWGRLGASQTQSSSCCPVVLPCVSRSPGAGSDSPAGLRERGIIVRCHLAAHLCFPPWALSS